MNTAQNYGLRYRRIGAVIMTAAIIILVLFNIVSFVSIFAWALLLLMYDRCLLKKQHTTCIVIGKKDSPATDKVTWADFFWRTRTYYQAQKLLKLSIKEPIQHTYWQDVVYEDYRDAKQGEEAKIVFTYSRLLGRYKGFRIDF